MVQPPPLMGLNGTNLLVWGPSLPLASSPLSSSPPHHRNWGWTVHICSCEINFARRAESWKNLPKILFLGQESCLPGNLTGCHNHTYFFCHLYHGNNSRRQNIWSANWWGKIGPKKKNQETCISFSVSATTIVMHITLSEFTQMMTSINKFDWFLSWRSVKSEHPSRISINFQQVLVFLSPISPSIPPISPL